MKYDPKAQFRPRKRGKGLVEKGRAFIPGIAKEANYLDEASVKRIYVAMVRYIVTALRKDGLIRLPNFGDFWVVFRREKVFNIPKYLGGGSRVIPRTRQIRFVASKQLRAYFKMLEGNSFGENGRFVKGNDIHLAKF